VELRRPYAPERWAELYRWICEQLGLDERSDRRAAELLAELMRGREVPIAEAMARLAGRDVAILGGGNTLQAGLLVMRSRLAYARTVAADGATAAALELGLVPDIIVTDLDGPHDVLREAYTRGSLLAVHAHGDNMEMLRGFVPGLSRLMGTCQVEPAPPPLINPYGFTDGDRAAYLAYALGARRIYLVGMELREPAGRFSSMARRSPLEMGRRLHIARTLLDLLARAGAELYSLGPSPASSIGQIDL
jgi:uncharacterized Rossmann fold enzyme